MLASASAFGFALAFAFYRLRNPDSSFTSPPSHAPNSSVWFVPDYGLEFQPARTWKAHKGAVNAIASTWRHMLSVGDDGVLMVYELESLARIRRLDVREWCVSRQLLSRPDIPRRLKCISVQEDQEEGGMVAVGTNYGDIVVFSIGRMV